MPYQLHYFTLRLWLEELGEGQTEWRGEVRSSKTGEVRYFRQGPMLNNLLTAMLAESRQENTVQADGCDDEIG